MDDVGERPLTRLIGTRWRGLTQDLGWLHDLSWRKDLLLPIVVGIVQLGAAYGAQHHHHPQTPLGIGDWALLVVGPLALVARRRHPVAVMWVTFLATLGPSASRFANLSLIVSFFVAATSGHRRAAWAVIVIGYVGSLWLAPLVWGESVATLDGALLLGAWLAVLVVVAEVVRMRREHVVEARVARQADVRHRASEERIRMARDLHDVIGHNISLINVQAGVGLDLMDSQPDQARAALAAIKTVSKEAIEELRTMLNALRQDDEDAPRAPAPGLDRLPELVDLTRAAGLAVTMQISGRPVAVPTAVDLAGYRIVQESLTNVARHAGPVTTTVRLTYDVNLLVIEVANSGYAAIPVGAVGASAGTSSGSGIVGMRERAAALGGSLLAGPRLGGGFQVTARLPFGGAT